MILVHAYVPKVEGDVYARHRAGNRICERWGGLTVTDGHGLWQDGNGHVQHESIELWEVACEDTEDAVRTWWRVMARRLARELDQTEVRFSLTHGESIVVRVDA